MPEEEMLDTDQVAELLGVHEETVKRAMRARKIEYYKVGRRYKMTRQAVDDYVERQRVPTVVEIK